MSEAKRELYRLWCEWDIGHEDVVFKSKESALEWADSMLYFNDIDEPLASLLRQGLIGTTEVTLIGGKDE